MIARVPTASVFQKESDRPRSMSVRIWSRCRAAKRPPQSRRTAPQTRLQQTDPRIDALRRHLPGRALVELAQQPLDRLPVLGLPPPVPQPQEAVPGGSWTSASRRAWIRGSLEPAEYARKVSRVIVAGEVAAGESGDIPPGCSIVIRHRNLSGYIESWVLVYLSPPGEELESALNFRWEAEYANHPWRHPSPGNPATGNLATSTAPCRSGARRPAAAAAATAAPLRPRRPRCRARREPAARREAQAKAALEKSPRHGEYVDVKLPSGGTPIRTWVVYPERKDKAPRRHRHPRDLRPLRLDPRRRRPARREGFIAVAPDLISGLGPNGGGTDSVAEPRRRRRSWSASSRPRRRPARLDAVRAYAHQAPRRQRQERDDRLLLGRRRRASPTPPPSRRSTPPSSTTAPRRRPPTSAAIKAPVLGFYGGDDARVDADRRAGRGRDEEARQDLRARTSTRAPATASCAPRRIATARTSRPRRRPGRGRWRSCAST